MNFIEELKWRGMIQDSMPGIEEHLNEEMRTAYVGIDPTADSLHIGHLVSIMMLRHLQRAGHKPIVLLGGATGMIGDPSGKSKERNLLNEETLNHNQEAIRKQLMKFFDWNPENKNSAVLVNNYDWMKNFSFIDFIRDVGKSITVNYMMAKDSVKRRLQGIDDSEGMSFTEFTYQLVQGNDFLHLFRTMGATIQMGGSDQWGNITTGSDLIRKIENEKAFAVTCPLITKADGKKFGKTEKGNIWLDPKRTTPYEFYQYWLSVSDSDAEKFIKIFTFLSKDEIDNLIFEHNKEPHNRLLQTKLAEELTIMVHSEKALETVKAATKILFGNSTTEDLKKLSKEEFLQVFNGVKTARINRDDIVKGMDMIEALSSKTNFLDSNSNARRALKENSVSVNKIKISEDKILTESDLLNDNYILLSRGKKKNFLIIVE